MLAITELGNADERWRTLFDAMAEGFFVAEIVKDNVGNAVGFRFAGVNPAFEKLTTLVNTTGARLPTSRMN